MPNIAKSLHYPTKGQSCVIQKTIDRFARKLAWKPVKSLTQCFLSMPLKTSENLSFSHASRQYRKGALALKKLIIHQSFVSTLYVTKTIFFFKEVFATIFEVLLRDRLQISFLIFCAFERIVFYSPWNHQKTVFWWFQDKSNNR